MVDEFIVPFPGYRINAVLGKYRVLIALHNLGDILHLRLGSVFRFLDDDQPSLGSGVDAIRFGIPIPGDLKFHQIAACNIFRIIWDINVLELPSSRGSAAGFGVFFKRQVIHGLGRFFQIRDVDPIFADLRLFLQDVSAVVKMVQIEIDLPALRRVGHFDVRRHPETDLVADQRVIPSVAGQRPSFRLAHAQQARLLMELDCVSFFVKLGGSMAPQLDMVERAVVPDTAVFVQQEHAAGFPVIL